jgi:hypothetical protein
MKSGTRRLAGFISTFRRLRATILRGPLPELDVIGCSILNIDVRGREGATAARKTVAMSAPPSPPEGHFFAEGLPFAPAAAVQF